MHHVVVEINNFIAVLILFNFYYWITGTFSNEMVTLASFFVWKNVYVDFGNILIGVLFQVPIIKLSLCKCLLTYLRVS